MNRATQSAQVMERKASDSKRRFVSYSTSILLYTLIQPYTCSPMLLNLIIAFEG